VPDGKNPQAWNRYAYTLNSPLRYIDPSGHGQCDPANGKCEGGPNTSGSKDGVGGDGPKRPVESGKEVGEPNGPYQKVYTDSSGRLVRVNYDGKAYIDGKTQPPEAKGAVNIYRDVIGRDRVEGTAKVEPPNGALEIPDNLCNGSYCFDGDVQVGPSGQLNVENAQVTIEGNMWGNGQDPLSLVVKNRSQVIIDGSMIGLKGVNIHVGFSSVVNVLTDVIGRFLFR
jgi:hypothetical protein